ncbi:reverse transcriptase domain-containing protein [Tanacetum coccineum]|uniref:Reverse transcriptase domain-containing protein n=1 Tax=Tanacetum coccineum TaxID=301880 RepID=A0ABQ5DK73_9ASTR
MRRAFISRFFPPSLFNRLLLEIRNFSQTICESLTYAWLRLKNMLRKCHGHGITKGAIIQIFYHGLDEPTQGMLNETAGGIFLYKSPNQAFQFLKDKVLFKPDWSTKSQNEHHQKSVAFADGNNKAIDSQSTQTIKLPILQPGEYALWKMRMEQYLQCIDYTLWKFIENGNAPIVTKTVDDKETVIPPISVEKKAQRRAELKARSTLLIAIPNEHQLKFNSYKDAKTLM